MTLLIKFFLFFFISSSVFAFEFDNRHNRVKEAGYINVCIWPDYYAITYKNAKTGELTGFDIDLAREFADFLQVDAVFVDSSFSTLAENMQNDKCDIAMHGVGIREARKSVMEFSEPYLESGIYAISNDLDNIIKGWEDIDQHGIVVAVQKGTYMEPVMRETLKQGEISVVDSFKAREQALLSGRADVFMTDYPYGKKMVELTNWAKLHAPPQALSLTRYAYAVPKGEKKWLAVVNDFVEKVKRSGKLTQYADKHGLTEILYSQ